MTINTSRVGSRWYYFQCVCLSVCLSVYVSTNEKFWRHDKCLVVQIVDCHTSAWLRVFWQMLVRLFVTQRTMRFLAESHQHDSITTVGDGDMKLGRCADGTKMQVEFDNIVQSWVDRFFLLAALIDSWEQVPLCCPHWFCTGHLRDTQVWWHKLGNR